MIVVAIIGVLAAVALPAYQNYTARAKISEVLLALSNCRTSISETIQSAPFVPAGGSWGCETQAGTAPSRYVKVIETSDEGAVRVQVQNISSLVNDQYVVMRPWPDLARSGPLQPGDVVAVWDCGPDSVNNIEDISRMLPGSCRSSAADIGATSGWASAS